MASIVKILRVAADPNRLRILLLLRAEELSVAELQEILTMGQSTISTHLAQLKQAGLVEDRRTGKSNLYRLIPPQARPEVSTGSVPPEEEHENSPRQFHSGLVPPVGGGETSPEQVHSGRVPPEGENENSPRQAQRNPGNSAKEITAPRRGAAKTVSSGPAITGPESTDRTFLDELLARAAAEIHEAPDDQTAMRRVLRKRQDKTRAFFDSVAGRLGRDYVPGKSWKSLAEALLRIMPPMTIADLGAGEGAFALLLAARARKVIAIDSSARMIEVGREQAARHGIINVDFRLGDMEELPIGSGEVELVFFSQSLHHALHPAHALEEAWRILSPGGSVAVLDLAKHRFEEARELYADEWLGFSEAELETMLENAGFSEVSASVVDKEPETPQFQTLLAVGAKRA
jgi:ubiquinone/menaquinone biosynthesis C-methylase UbiE/DNA-binding transcriptional ArsR family regulator